MTWRLPGRLEATLTDADAKLFASALAYILDIFSPYDEDDRYGICAPITTGPFERLTTFQQLTVLEDVTMALLTETPVPKLTAVNENAIYWVFRQIAAVFYDEAEMGEVMFGELVLAALGRTGKDPKESSADGDEEEDEEEGDPDSDPYMGCLDKE